MTELPGGGLPGVAAYKCAVGSAKLLGAGTELGEAEFSGPHPPVRARHREASMLTDQGRGSRVGSASLHPAAFHTGPPARDPLCKARAASPDLFSAPRGRVSVWEESRPESKVSKGLTLASMSASCQT